MGKRSPLDDPRTAAHAWLRYRRLMWWMFALTLVVVSIALWLVYREAGLESVHYFIATALGVGLTMLLTSALMGLMFLSSGTGHDEAIDDRIKDEDGWDQDGEDGRNL